MNIIFGTKKLGQIDGSNGSYQKYSDRAVITLEGDRGKGRTRRVLFNSTSMDFLNLEKGDTQQIVFGTIDADEKGNRAIYIANADQLSNIDDLTVYKTSKNRVSFDNSKEKGKGISSAALTKQMISFLGLDENTETEYELEPFNGTETLSDVYKFVALVPEGEIARGNDEDWNQHPGPEQQVSESFLSKTDAEPVVE